jgi:hypothetical protein
MLSVIISAELIVVNLSMGYHWTSPNDGDKIYKSKVEQFRVHQVAISNGVINLIPHKEAALSEIIRVLKPAGRLMVADQIAAGSFQKDIKARLANWFQ